MAIRVLHIFGGGVRSGIETHILTLAKGLKGSGVEFVLAPLNKGSFSEEVQSYVSEIIESDKKYRGDLGFIGRLAKRISAADVDIVHTHSFDGSFYGNRAALQAGEKVIVNTVHTFETVAMVDVYKSRIIRRLVCRQNLRLLKSASLLIAVCRPLEEKLIHEGIDSDKIRVVPNGLDLPDFLKSSPNQDSARRELGLKDGELAVGILGRVARVKNIDVFLKAGKKVLDKGVRVKFIIIGDGPLRGRMEALASKLGIQDSVRFVGWQAETGTILSALDLFVLCSQTETTSYALLEAMAMAKPTVATAVGGNTEVVEDGVTGLLVPPGDVDATSEAIFNLISDRDRSKQFGAAGKERVEREFSAGAMVDRTLEVYRELAGDGAPVSGRKAVSAY
jgi:glycosyltransferase involved in cell wall biosynthesis